MSEITFDYEEDEETPVNHATQKIPITPDLIALMLQSHEVEMWVNLAVTPYKTTVECELRMMLDNGETHNAKLN